MRDILQDCEGEGGTVAARSSAGSTHTACNNTKIYPAEYVSRRKDRKKEMEWEDGKDRKKAKKKKGLEDTPLPDSDEPGNKKMKVDDSKKTDDVKLQSNGSKFNMFAEQARREKEEDSRPVKDRGPVTSNQVAKLPRPAAGIHDSFARK